MLDSFRLSHRQVLIRDDRRRYIEEFTFRAVGDLAATSLDPPDRTFLNKTRSVGDNMSFYGLWARQYLREFRAHNSNIQGARLAHIDEKLLQIIILHKLMRRLDSRESAELRIAHHAVGAMIQRDLTLLLAEVRLEQWSRLFNLWKLRGIEPSEWEKHIAGASAATYVLMTLASRDGSEVFLPSGHEDVTLGVDLFWLERGRLHAVSVKCVTGQVAPVRTWQVHELPHNGHGDRITNDMRTIFSGAERFASQQESPCHPILVHVAKPEGGAINLNQNWTRQIWPDQLLAQRGWQALGGSLDLAR